MGRHQKVDKEGGLKWEGIIPASHKHAFFDRAEYWECRFGNWDEEGEKFRPSGQNGHEAQCLLSAKRPLSPTPMWSNYRQARARLLRQLGDVCMATTETHYGLSSSLAPFSKSLALTSTRGKIFAPFTKAPTAMSQQTWTETEWRHRCSGRFEWKCNLVSK